MQLDHSRFAIVPRGILYGYDRSSRARDGPGPGGWGGWGGGGVYKLCYNHHPKSLFFNLSLTIIAT